MTADMEKKVAAIGGLARAHFESRAHMCAESVLLALNTELSGGVNDAHAMALAAPFSEGMGGSGCACGALSGAILAIGLFTGSGEAFGYRRRSRDAARRFHGIFTERFGSACCRVLCRKVRHDARQHFAHCAALTAQTAELAARFILERRPSLVQTPASGGKPVGLAAALDRFLPWLRRVR